MELQLYIPYRILAVGPLHFASLRDCGSSLLRTTGPLDSPRRLPLRHARSPTLRVPPLRSSSGGFEQLRPSSGRLRSEPLGSTLFAFVVHFAVHPLPRSESNAFDDGFRHRAKVANAFDDGLHHRAKVAYPIVAPRGFGCSSEQPKVRPSGAWNAASSATLRACERERTSCIYGVKREGKKKTCRQS